MSSSVLNETFKRTLKVTNNFDKIAESELVENYQLNKTDIELLSNGMNKNSLKILNEVLYKRFYNNSNYDDLDIEGKNYYYNLVQISKLQLDTEIDSNTKEKFEKIFKRSIDSRGFNYFKRFRVALYEHLDEIKFSKEELYILALAQFVVAEMLFLMTVKFNKNYERKVAHYTNIDVSRFLIHKKTKFRLSSTEKMNDPSEGKLLFDYLGLKLEEGYKPLLTFLSCFTLNHNSLNHFRLYGKTDNIDCSGVSLVVDENFFHKYAVNSVKINNVKKDNKLSLYRCSYIDINTGYFELSKRSKFSFFQEHHNLKVEDIEEIWNKYIKLTANTEKSLRTSMQDLKGLCEFANIKGFAIDELLKIISQPLKFLFKHFSFQEEQECRMIYVCELNDDIVNHDYEKNLTYINYDQDMVDSLTNIYVGTASEKILTPLSIEVSKVSEKIKVKLLEAPFRVEKELIKLNKID